MLQCKEQQIFNKREKKGELCLNEQSYTYKIVMRVAEGGRMEGL